MNIKMAKQEIIHTVAAYLEKDETGAYEIPTARQRPILLMGPPGIGKTAVMEQVAAECGINLISYTITHHTRQSAIGLPFITKQTFDGREYAVTEYTMSEIIGAVYEQIERSGVREGILFLDEINCVSETLSPTMLQFLQYKMFGTHHLPEGFLIVTAGNPPEYNQAVRDFDIATLDRVRRIDIDVDYDAWREYAYQAEIHGSILSYLEIRREHFYSVETGLEGKRFVTARGWEDLSRIIRVYEKLGHAVTEDLVKQYLQSPEIASDFAAYYELYNRYHETFRIEEILTGELEGEGFDFRGAPFDEKLSLIGLLTDRLSRGFRAYCLDTDIQKRLMTELRPVLKETDLQKMLTAWREGLTEKLSAAEEAGIAGEEELLLQRRVLQAARALCREADELSLAQKSPAAEGSREEVDLRVLIKDWFRHREQRRVAEAKETSAMLTRAFRYLEKTFGTGQEIVIFLTELSANASSLRFINECGNDAFHEFNRMLLLKDRRDALIKEVQDLIL